MTSRWASARIAFATSFFLAIGCGSATGGVGDQCAEATDCDLGLVCDPTTLTCQEPMDAGSGSDAGGTDAGQGPDAGDDAAGGTDAGTDAAIASDAGTDAAIASDAGTDGGGVCAMSGESCSSGGSCCSGLNCCSGVPVPPGSEFCAPTCPICAAPDTPIATPSGERAIATLEVGDLVYSEEGGAMVAVPLLAVSRTAVVGHHVMRVVLDDGRELFISPGHPTATGGLFAELEQGDDLGGVGVTQVERVPYLYGYTYDILPASDSGTYIAAGALIGSTLVR